ncbi:MAG: dihydroxy-acid dehydratase [Deltaproteobacteria bacterium]|nr:dihydroxy-acid dehydratase [Deltaproteobacteria bacterium]
MRASQKSRHENAEIDPLLMGAGWTLDDLDKPQVLLESNGYFERTALYLKNYRIEPGEVIRSLDNPYDAGGGLRILYGNLAPGGAVVKHAAMAKEMQRHTGPARPFDSEEGAIAAIENGSILAGDVIVIRYEGPRGLGMPEMFKTTEILHRHPDLRDKVALVTDGRFSGATQKGASMLRF